MSLNKSLRKILATQDVATITVDIFDTVLYRDIWPEGLQFIETAERSLELFHDAISPSITPFEVYSWREYT